MDESELIRLERDLLAMLSEPDLDWVRSSVQEGIAAGRPEEVHVRRERQGEEVLPFDVDGDGTYSSGETFNTSASRMSSKGQRLVRNVPLTPTERVILIIEAGSRRRTPGPTIPGDIPASHCGRGIPGSTTSDHPGPRIWQPALQHQTSLAAYASAHVEPNGRFKCRLAPTAQKCQCLVL